MSEAEILLDYYRKQVQIIRDKFPDWHDDKYYDSSFHGQYPFYYQNYIKDIETGIVHETKNHNIYHRANLEIYLVLSELVFDSNLKEFLLHSTASTPCLNP